MKNERVASQSTIVYKLLTNPCENSLVSFCDKERMMSWFAKMIFDGGGEAESSCSRLF